MSDPRRAAAIALGALATIVTTQALAPATPFRGHQTRSGPSVAAAKTPGPPAPAPSGVTALRTTTSVSAPGHEEPVAEGLRRSEANALYLSAWVPASQTPFQPTSGDSGTCAPFAMTADAESRFKDAVNFARALDGLDPVTLDGRFAALTSRAALIMAANRRLTHTPSSSTSCYSAVGADGAQHSLLSLYGNTDFTAQPTVADVVSGYLTDPGTENLAAGHRRWLLNPTLADVTLGGAHSILQGWSTYTASLWIWPTGNTTPSAHRPAHYAWPAAGWFPSQLEPNGRWSVSAAGVNFSAAHVTVSRDGIPLTVRVVSTETGYADNTVVFQVAGELGDGTYDVAISGIPQPFTYTVNLFTAG